jgi:hypothetical protein
MNARWRSGVVVALVVALASLGGTPAARADARSDGGADATGGEPYRAHFGWADLYVPTFFEAKNGSYDLVIHFHGLPFLQEANVEQAHLNAIVVSYNLGISSGVYSESFRGPRAFDSTLEEIQRQVQKSGRAPGARLGRVALSAWSAGFAAVGSILATPGNADRVDAVMLEDGPHANYIAPHVVNDGALTKWVDFGVRAMKGQKLFALTHSSIMTEGYPSTTETIGEMIKMLGVEKVPRSEVGPRSMKEIYEVSRGDLHVKGYLGTSKQDHIDHIKGMSETVLPYLKARWNGD